MVGEAGVDAAGHVQDGGDGRLLIGGERLGPRADKSAINEPCAELVLSQRALVRSGLVVPGSGGAPEVSCDRDEMIER
jgi:hypothetical protein